MFISWAGMDAQLGECATTKISKIVIWSVIMAISARSTLGTTTENYNVPTTDFGNSGAVNATLNRTSNDPCSNYTILSERWRNVNELQSSTIHCDNLLTSGVWYRFMLPAGNAIPETVPPVNSCGTSAPMWLNGAHPRSVSNTPVERQLCANWADDPCRWSTVVQVALCPGGYYVYKAPLIAAPVCDLAWCAVDTNENVTQAAICQRQGDFYCSLSQQCVSYNYRCDGYPHCIQYEDETACANSSIGPSIVASSCGGTLYGFGVVRSPNFPSSYVNGLNCNWTLIASPYNASVVLAFSNFSTESCCDYLSIYNSSGALVTRFFGTFVPSIIVLPNRAYISFTTDGSVVSTGFSVRFTSSDASATNLSSRYSCESQGKFYCALSYLCVPMSYRCNGDTSCFRGEDEINCTTAAPPPTTSTASLRDSCLSQGKFYCQTEGRCIYSSWRCDGTVDCLYSEDELGCSGRTSTLSPTTASLSSCGGTLYGSGYIRSPNYPSSYGNNINCTWTLYASPYYGSVVLQFYSFNTESCCDFLSIYNSNGALVNRYSGTTYPNSIVLGSTAVVRFTTDSSVTYSGFSIWFSTSESSVSTTTTLSPRDSCEQQGYFYCSLSNLCIASWRRCDGDSYCYYGEDESGCTSLSTSPSVTPSQRDSCLRQGNFYCEFSRECIAMWRRCDGYAYCYYGEDESGCVNTTATSRPASEQPGGSFIAASGNAQLFLQLSKSSAKELSRGRWIVVSGYVTALLLGLPRFHLR